jgi:hypothetical protein
VLEEPRSEYVGGDLGEDASLFLILLPVRIVIFLPCALPAPDAGITGITGTAEEDGGVKDASSRSVAGRPSVWRRRPFSPRTPFACKKRERLGWAAGTTIYNIDPQRTPEEPMEAERRGRSEGFFDVSPSIRIQQPKTSSQRNQMKIFLHK